jgi:tetratricopeptide (TPR) repeat protein
MRLGYAYTREGLYGKAYLLFEKARRLAPQDPRILLYLAEIYQRQGLRSRAETTMEQFLRSMDKTELCALFAQLSAADKGFTVLWPDKQVILPLMAKVFRKRCLSLEALFRDSTDEKGKLATTTNSP